MGEGEGLGLVLVVTFMAIVRPMPMIANDHSTCERCRSNMQTCHSIDMKNLDLTNKKSGSGGKNRDHGPVGYKKK